MRYRVHAWCCVAATMVLGQASATSPSLEVDVLAPSKGLSGSFEIATIDLRINSGDVVEVAVESTLIAGLKTPVGKSLMVETTILPRFEESELAPGEGEAWDLDEVDGFAMANAGDVVRLPSPQLIHLAQGPYMEILRLTVHMAGAMQPRTYQAYRFFNVTQRGISWLDALEYDDLVAPKALMPRPDGSVALVHVGGLGPADPEAAAAIASGNQRAIEEMDK